MRHRLKFARVLGTAFFICSLSAPAAFGASTPVRDASISAGSFVQADAKADADKAKADQDKAKADQDKAKGDQDKAKAGQDKAKAGQDKAKVDQDTAKTDQEKAKADQDKAKADQDKSKADQDKDKADADKSKSPPGCAFGNDQKNGQTATAPGCSKNARDKTKGTQTTATGQPGKTTTVVVTPSGSTQGITLSAPAPVTTVLVLGATVSAAPAVTLPGGATPTSLISISATTPSGQSAANTVVTAQIPVTGATLPAVFSLVNGVATPLMGTISNVGGQQVLTVSAPTDANGDLNLVLGATLSAGIVPVTMPATGAGGGSYLSQGASVAVASLLLVVLLSFATGQFSSKRRSL